MLKKITSVFIVFVLAFSYQVVFASPSINEFMYDLDGADIDWVEIYNDGDDVDVTSLKLFISNSDSNHGIVKYSGNEVLSNGEFGIIVPTSQIGAFTSKWGTGGNIFTSSFSLPNTSATIEINNGDKNSPISSVSYESGDGAAGDRKSLQLVSGSWRASTPTVGQVNQIEAVSDEEETEDEASTNENTIINSTSSSKTATTPVKRISKTSKIKAEIQVAGIAYVGIPTAFQGKVIGVDGELLRRGRYFWNFGDGDSREVKTIGADKFNHTYFYPGDYTVTLEYFPNAFAEIPEVSEEVVIKVVTAGVSITRVGDEKDFFIELTNDTTYDIDISKWKLVSEFKVFNFPRNTNLASKKKMIISSRLTNFSIGDKNTLKLFDSEGKMIFDYPLSLVAPKTSKMTGVRSANSVSRFINNYENFDEENVKYGEGEDLSASAFTSGVLGDKSYLPILASIIFIGTSAGAVYFIRKQKSNPSNGDDFEILKD